ncbi:hypothetical protein JTE90_010775 [Oedothorax gibbosus]|uniref:Uncharacterized protein n=1 Tax=Oedothorax gibbosus TaxID=931172 RepID=A0AAV6TX07_9ARAC|nr:hypothetical protein JTE90_010775 [Oedothorax gibbosus]
MDEEDVPCDVCRSTEVEPDNNIIFCDTCDIAVHQACYGVEEIPSGSWLCKPCENNVQPTCIFCKQKKGAMKKTVNERWAHVNCTLWIPETNFAIPETMDIIQNVEKIPKSRWGLSCFICRVKGGACIQCYIPTCKTAYHVTCGYNNGLHMKMEDIVTSESEIIFQSFCRKHTQNMSSLGKKKRNSTEDKIVDQFPSNTASIDSTTKAHSNKKFRSYLEELKEGVQPNLEQNISMVNVISEEVEENVELESPTSTSKNVSDSNGIDITNFKNVKVKEEKEFFFNLSNPSTTEDNVNDKVTVEKVINQSMGPNESGNQLLVHHNMTNRTYVGTFLVGKATARKSCASPNNVQVTVQNKMQRIILNKSREIMGNKVQGVTPNKVQGTLNNKVQGENPKNKVKKVRQLSKILPKKIVKERKTPNMQQQKAKGKKPKTPPKRKVNQSPVANGSKTGPVSSPKLKKQANSNLTLNHLTVTPPNVLAQNNDQNLSHLGHPVAMFTNNSQYLPQSSTSMEIGTMMQNLPSSSTISNGSNLCAFLGYLGTLLQSLPMKKSLQVQKKVVALVLKEHNVSSSDDISDVYISDDSSTD